MGQENGTSAQSKPSDSKLNKTQKLNIDVASGLIAGVANSGLFNPWDRALYLSVKYHRPFLSWENFTAPYQGFSQALVQRAFLGSIYFIAQGELNTYMFPYLNQNLGLNPTAAQFYVGMAAGSIGGAMTNSISAVKYHTWGKENASFRSSVYDMWTHGGYKPFIKGTTATMTRDMVFGSTYEMLRHLMKNQVKKRGSKILIPISPIGNSLIMQVLRVLLPSHQVHLIMLETCSMQPHPSKKRLRCWSP